MKQKIATALLGGSILVHAYGVVALVLVWQKLPAWLLVAYMGLAVFTIPAFIAVRLLSPKAIWRKPAAERNRQERLFVKLYDINMLLAAGISLVLLIVAILHEKALRGI